jgi:hypothetical protein
VEREAVIAALCTGNPSVRGHGISCVTRGSAERTTALPDETVVTVMNQGTRLGMVVAVGLTARIGPGVPA